MTRARIVGAGEGELRGDEAAAALSGDVLLMHPGATLVLDTADAWAGAMWRLGAGALPLYLTRDARFTAERGGRGRAGRRDR